jgi:hypothetical protein
MIVPAGGGGSIRYRLPIYIKAALRKIDEPILLDAGCSIQGAPSIAIICQRELGYLDRSS